MSTAAAVELLLALITNASKISALIKQAKAEGREKLTPEEWQAILSADDAARKQLQDASA